jgi:hypothetical protein
MYSQIHEVGVLGSNYIGDVGTTYIAQMNLLLDYYINGTKAHDMPTVFIHPVKNRQMILILKNPVEVKEAIILKIV